jgi:hypothetical protein
MMELLLTVSPTAARRVQMLEFALELKRRGLKPRQITGKVRDHFEVSRTLAWSISSMAADL